MNKNIITAVVVGLLVVVGLVFWMSQAPKESANNNLQQEGESDSTTSINQSLEGVDVGDLDKEFQQIDIDLKTL